MILLQGGSWWQRVRFGIEQFLSPDNPFVDWMLILKLAGLLLYIYTVYWVYRDALQRYKRGAPWAAAAALLPVAGWLFYLFYRISPLVELDRIEAETFNEEEEPWTDFDQYQANRGSELFRELGAIWRRPEGGGYSAQVRLSRLRELRRTLTPAEKEARRAEREANSRRKREERSERALLARQRKADKKAKQTMTAVHGFKFTMSERRQRQVQKQLKLVQDLQRMPREDQLIEELIYEMDYAAAMQAAADSYAIAQEMGDEQGKITYQRYLERIEPLLADEIESHKREADKQ